MKKESLERFSVTLSRELLDFLDKEIIDKGFASRSEFIRDLIRERKIEEKWKSKEKVIGVLVVVFNHSKRDILSKIMDIQHKHILNILGTSHIHLDQNNCLEVITIKGKASEIEEIAIKIGGIKGVNFSKLVRTAKIDK